MLLSIFSQSVEPMGNPTRLTHEAERHFSLRLAAKTEALDVLSLNVEGQPAPTARLSCRSSTSADHQLARAAEQQSGAAGMGDLAARCPHVLELRLHPEADASVGYQLAACLAFVALGPILPEDHSRLLGVRSAMQMADRLKR